MEYDILKFIVSCIVCLGHICILIYVLVDTIRENKRLKAKEKEIEQRNKEFEKKLYGISFSDWKKENANKSNSESMFMSRADSFKILLDVKPDGLTKDDILKFLKLNERTDEIDEKDSDKGH